jgi:hypothetical protein
MVAVGKAIPALPSSQDQKPSRPLGNAKWRPRHHLTAGRSTPGSCRWNSGCQARVAGAAALINHSRPSAPFTSAHSIRLIHSFGLQQDRSRASPTAIQSCLRVLPSLSKLVAMAFGIGRAMITPLMVINFILYFISACLAGSILNRNFDGRTVGESATSWWILFENNEVCLWFRWGYLAPLS